jgi:hypothetical protein
MPLPTCEPYARFPDGVEDDTAQLVEIGPWLLWFSCGQLVAYETRSRGFVRVEPGPDRPDARRHLAGVAAARFVPGLPEEEFETRWEKDTDPHLFPKRVGKLRQDWPGLTADVPAPVLADWLEEHGQVLAARVVRHGDELVNAFAALLADWRGWVTGVTSHPSHAIGRRAEAALKAAGG